MGHGGEQLAVVGVGQQVGLVEAQDGLHAVGLGGGQEAVYEVGAGGGVGERCHEHGLVDVGGDDVTLLAEVDGAAHYVVAAVCDVGDVGRAVGAGRGHMHEVAHGHGVGGAQALDAEVALHLAVDFAPLGGFYHIVRAGVAHYASCCVGGAHGVSSFSSHPLWPKWCGALHLWSVPSTIQWHVAMLSMWLISWLTSRMVECSRTLRSMS